MLGVMRRLALTAPLALLVACSATPPANWTRGGATLDIPRARWVWGESAVDIAPDGKIFINGEHELNVDRGGRVFDADGQPVALVEQNGQVVGPGDKPLGMVGALHASLPDEEQAWLSVAPSGEVIRYGEEGERMAFGVWLGCNVSPRAHQTCTLISHLIGMKIRETQREGSGISVGIGVGVGIPVR
jgi:hypothetical protein